MFMLFSMSSTNLLFEPIPIFFSFSVVCLNKGQCVVSLCAHTARSFYVRLVCLNKFGPLEHNIAKKGRKSCATSLSYGVLKFVVLAENR